MKKSTILTAAALLFLGFLIVLLVGRTSITNPRLEGRFI